MWRAREKKPVLRLSSPTETYNSFDANTEVPGMTRRRAINWSDDDRHNPTHDNLMFGAISIIFDLFLYTVFMKHQKKLFFPQ